VNANTKPLAIGHIKEISLLKRIPDAAAAKILAEYVKKKTGRMPEIMNTFSGAILQSEQGKIFFRDGEIQFEPNPFHVKKVKSWPDEIKAILKFYASKIYIAEAKKVLYEHFNVVREQELQNGGFIFELTPSPDSKEEILRLVVTPNGRIAAFPIHDKTESAERWAQEILKTLETKGLIDF